MPQHSAALSGLHARRDAHNRRYKHFYMLANADMPALARVLRSMPDPTIFKERIRALPPYLRATGFHRSPSSSTGKVQPGHLCDWHKKLKKGFCYETLTMVQNEIGRIGRYTYGVILSGELAAWEELQARQLEPVPQMWVPGFSKRDSAPEGREPICPGYRDGKDVFEGRWGFEVSGCPACILARIGTVPEVLFALLAGMVARIHRRYRGPRNNLKSRRIRFVKEWLESHVGGPTLVDDAFSLGKRMRELKEAQKAHAHQGRTHGQQSSHGQTREDRARAMLGSEGLRIKMDSHDRPASRNAVEAVGHGDSAIDIDISDPFAPQHLQASRRSARPIQPATNRHTVIQFDLPDPLQPESPAFGNGIAPRQEGVFPPEGARGSDWNRGSTSGSTLVGVDISEPFIPNHTKAAVGEGVVHSEMTMNGFGHRPYSIASSFADNMSLSDVRAPSAHASLYPLPLNVPNMRPPPIPARSSRRLPRPHPLSIYGTLGQTDASASQYAQVSPPTSPAVRGEQTGQYDVSPPSSPELEEFEFTTPAMQSRPDTTWGGLYEN